MTRRSVFPDTAATEGTAVETAGAGNILVIAGVGGTVDRGSGKGLVCAFDGVSADGVRTVCACGVDSPVLTGETGFPD